MDMKWAFTALAITVVALATMVIILTTQRAGADLTPAAYVQAAQQIINSLGHGHTRAHCSLDPIGMTAHHYLIICSVRH